jgi:3-hydroxyisobutyrate dehydrogenase-like beta-hydroxyacid dehydrogenase
MTRIAWIGLGKLGLPMARRLAQAGQSVRGYDSDPARLALARASGIESGAAEEFRSHDLVFTSLPDDDVLRAVAVREGSPVAQMRQGATLVETSTVSIDVSEEVASAAAARHVTYVRLPVSGNPTLAETGSLTCFGSGPREAFDAVVPIVSAFTRAQRYLGAGEEARYAKLAVNLMIAVSAGMIAESLVLARKGNIAWRDILEVLADSAVASPMVKYKVEPLAERDFSSTFSCRQMAKDLDLILGAGRATNVPLPLAALIRETYAALMAHGEGGDDYIATVKHAERLAGLGEPDR